MKIMKKKKQQEKNLSPLDTLQSNPDSPSGKAFRMTPERVRWQNKKKKFSKTLKYTSELFEGVDKDGEPLERIIGEKESVIPVWPYEAKYFRPYREYFTYSDIWVVVAQYIKKRDLHILIDRFRWNYTNEKIGERFGLTKQRVGQIISSVCHNLKINTKFQQEPVVTDHMLYIMGHRRFKGLFPNWGKD